MDKIEDFLIAASLGLIALIILVWLGLAAYLICVAPDQTWTSSDSSTTQPYVVPVPVPYTIPPFTHPSTSSSPYSPHEDPIVPHVEEPIVPHVVVP